MEFLIVLLIVVGAILFLVFVWRFGFQKSDPTRAKIPDHMKRGAAWKAYDKEEEEKRMRWRDLLDGH